MRARRELLLLLPLLLLLAAVAAGASMRGKTLSEFANTDWAAYLGDRPAIERHIKCVLDKMPCDESGQKLKKLVPLMVVAKCGGCTPMQRRNAETVKRFLHAFYPGVWQSLEEKYGG